MYRINYHMKCQHLLMSPWREGITVLIGVSSNNPVIYLSFVRHLSHLIILSGAGTPEDFSM